MVFDLEQCARTNVLALKPYRCARDDYKDDGTNVLLDANENAIGPGLDLGSTTATTTTTPVSRSSNSTSQKDDIQLRLTGLNRYPDPHQIELKQLLCNLRNIDAHTSKRLTPENLFVGVGSDEAVDAMMRCFCMPARDKILTCPPTYGMYAVSAQVNDVAIESVPLDPDNGFAVQPELVNAKLTEDPSIKLVYLCSPGNPTASLVAKDAVEKILKHPTWNGIVIVDEAYIDFAPDQASLSQWVTEWPNLAVMQTLSKAFGLAGIRLGAVFTSPPIARLLNNIKAPYNVSEITSQIACKALSKQHLAVMRRNKDTIVAQRERLVVELPKIEGVGRFRGGLEANFLLVEMLDRPSGKPCSETALKVYEALAETKGVVVRFRGKEYGCEGCLRITVGTESEVDRFLRDLKIVLAGIYSERVQQNGNGTVTEQKREKEANAVVA